MFNTECPSHYNIVLPHGQHINDELGITIGDPEANTVIIVNIHSIMMSHLSVCPLLQGNHFITCLGVCVALLIYEALCGCSYKDSSYEHGQHISNWSC